MFPTLSGAWVRGTAAPVAFSRSAPSARGLARRRSTARAASAPPRLQPLAAITSAHRRRQRHRQRADRRWAVVLGGALRTRRRVRRPGCRRHSALGASWCAPRGHRARNTTLVVVATDAALTKAQAKRLAVMAQDGLARDPSGAHPSRRRRGVCGLHLEEALPRPRPCFDERAAPARDQRSRLGGCVQREQSMGSRQIERPCGIIQPHRGIDCQRGILQQLRPRAGNPQAADAQVQRGRA